MARAGWFAVLVLLVSAVADGYSGRPSEPLHQLLLIPCTALFLWATGQMLRTPAPLGPVPKTWWTPARNGGLAVVLELWFLAALAYEVEHFAAYGYRLRTALWLAALLPGLAFLAFAARKAATSWRVPALAAGAAYLGGAVASILSFPLNYLRSDMLPVIVWAGGNLLHGTDPYRTMFVAGRVYDFPYLPGMLLAFVPFLACHVDVRWGGVFYVLATAALVLWAARRERRLHVAALLSLVLLSPFLQFRHELYIQPHWFSMILALVLFQRRRFGWSAVAFGVSCAIYQLSWVILPFFLLNAFRRRGWGELLRLSLLALVAALAIDGPFLASALHRVASNTVGQWNLLPHALAEPMNLSYWATFVIAPAHLQRLQALLMGAIFGWCILRRRCATATDTLRWMLAALTLFVLLNVIVDGYFFLSILMLALAFVCVANGWWHDPGEPPTETNAGPPQALTTGDPTLP